jgi:hypothetical protein
MIIPYLFRASLNASVVTTRFHIANYSGKVVGITEIHNTAGDHADAVTLHVTKESAGKAPGAGVSLMSNTFNLKGTANTKQTATLSSAFDTSGKSVLEFVAGDMFSVKLTGNAQTAAGVLIVVWVQPYTAAMDFSFYSAASTSQDQCFFVANRPYTIQAIRCAYTTAQGSAATMQVVQDTSTNAPGAGTDLLSTAFNMNTTTNTPQLGALAAAAATAIPEGDRLAVDFAGTYNTLAGVCVTVTVTPQKNRLEVPYFLYDPDNADMWFFDANRDYELIDGRFVQAVAAGGVSTAQIEKTLPGTGNASGGTALLNTAWNLNATSNTVVVADLVTVLATKMITQNSRLAIDYANAEQSTAGICFTLSLMAR